MTKGKPIPEYHTSKNTLYLICRHAFFIEIYTSDRTSNQRLCEPEYLYINTCIGHLSYWG